MRHIYLTDWNNHLPIFKPLFKIKKNLSDASGAENIGCKNYGISYTGTLEIP